MRLGASIEFDVREEWGQTEVFSESLHMVEEVEKAGFNCVWLGERHFQPGRSVLSSPIVVASAIAARTERIRIGIAVQVLPLNHPIRIAEEAATVDQISQGRFDFGIGRSSLALSYEGYNVPYSERYARFWECLEVVRKAWTDDVMDYEGEYYSFHNVRLVPKPYQKPHPPIRMAATQPETYEEVGRMGFPIFVMIGSGVIGDLAPHIEDYCRGWHDAGHPGEPDVAVRVPVYVAGTMQKAQSEPKESIMAFFQRQARLLESRLGDSAFANPEFAARVQRLRDLTYDDVLERRVVFGTPDEVVQRLCQLGKELSLSMVVAEVNTGGRLPREHITNSVDLLGKEVIPHLA